MAADAERLAHVIADRRLRIHANCSARTVVADIMRVEVAQGQMQVTREFGVQNASKPPRTQMNERNLEFYVPAGARIIEESASATTENGNPLKSAPVPEGEKNRYSFIFPLRPGLTR